MLEREKRSMGDRTAIFDNPTDSWRLWGHDGNGNAGSEPLADGVAPFPFPAGFITHIDSANLIFDEAPPRPKIIADKSVFY